MEVCALTLSHLLVLSSTVVWTTACCYSMTLPVDQLLAVAAPLTTGTRFPNRPRIVARKAMPGSIPLLVLMPPRPVLSEAAANAASQRLLPEAVLVAEAVADAVP